MSCSAPEEEEDKGEQRIEDGVGGVWDLMPSVSLIGCVFQRPTPHAHCTLLLCNQSALYKCLVTLASSPLND